MSGKLNITYYSLFVYALMAFPISFAGVPLYIHAPDFYVSQFGISLATIGLTLLFLRIIDAVQDPIIGYLSDIFTQRRKAIFLIGVILLAVGFYCLFNPASENKLMWFIGSVYLASTGFSIISINLNALGGIWSDDTNTKTTISSWREAFGLIGLILAAALPSFLVANNSVLSAFSTYSSIMVGSLLVISFIFINFWLSKLIFEKTTTTKLSFSEVISSISRKKLLFLSYFISMLASSIPAVLIIFFVRDLLDLEKYTGLFLVVYFLAGAVSIIIWNKAAKKFGKVKAWLFSMVLAVASFIWAYFLQVGDFYPYLIICILSGIAFGAELVLPPSILADKIESNSFTTDYSVLAFLSKAALAIATGISFPLLQLYGYSPASENSMESLHALSFLYALLPCAIKIISIIMLILILKKEGNHEVKITHINYRSTNV